MFGGVCISRGPHFLISWVFFAVFWASAILKKDGWLLTTSYYSSSPKRSPLTAIDSLLPESLAAPLKGMFRTEADKWCTFNDIISLYVIHSESQRFLDPCPSPMLTNLITFIPHHLSVSHTSQRSELFIYWIAWCLQVNDDENLSSEIHIILTSEHIWVKIYNCKIMYTCY